MRALLEIKTLFSVQNSKAALLRVGSCFSTNKLALFVTCINWWSHQQSRAHPSPSPALCPVFQRQIPDPCGGSCQWLTGQWCPFSCPGQLCVCWKQCGYPARARLSCPWVLSVPRGCPNVPSPVSHCPERGTGGEMWTGRGDGITLPAPTHSPFVNLKKAIFKHTHLHSEWTQSVLITPNAVHEFWWK